MTVALPEKQISYYPCNAGWDLMWTTGWNLAVIAADFAKLVALGARTVRIIVQPSAIGYPVPNADMLLRVEQVVDLARDHGLRVHLTLFDRYPQVFSDSEKLSGWAGSKTWAKIMLGEFVADPAIACVEVHNEVDPAYPQVMAWTKAMIPYCRKAGGHPVTVSLADHGVTAFKLLVAALGTTGRPDFWSYHFYGGFSDGGTAAFAELSAVKAACVGLPLFIGETGQSTAPGYATEANQALYFGRVAKLCADPRLALPPPAPWILYDGPGSDKEDGFGLYREDGTAKPAAAAVAAMFAT